MSQPATQGGVGTASIQRMMGTVMVNQHDEATRLLDGVHKQLLEVAVTLTDAKQIDKVAQLRKQYAELLKLQFDVIQHKDAVRQLSHTYVVQEQQQTNFKQLLDTAVGEHQFDPEDTPDMKVFDQETGSRAAANGLEDDDVEMQADGNVFLNNKCPYTMKPVMELANPVEDSHGYIYEKSAIQNALRQARDHTIRCPVAGTNHLVTSQTLVPSERVRRELRRQMMQGEDDTGAHAAGRKDNVYDVDQL